MLLALLGLEPAPDDLNTPAGRAWMLLGRIQTETDRISGEDAAALWPLHLYGYSFIGLKWGADTPAQHGACGLLAAVALNRMLGWPEPAEERRPADALPADVEQRETAVVRAPQAAPRREIEAEGPAEILILVARFAGTAEYDPTARIYGALADHVFEVIPDIGRVELLDEIVSARREAIALAERYQASMVVWGTYDGLGIRPRYEVTRDSLVIKKSMIQLDQATRHQLKEKFDIYITDNLAAEVSFLSLQAVGDMCVLNLNYEAALGVYERALALFSDPERARALGVHEIYQSLTGVYLALKRYGDALAANAKARELAPDDLLCQFQWLLLRSVTEKRTSNQMIEDLRALLTERVEDGSIDREEQAGLSKALEMMAAIRSPQDLKKLFESTSNRKSLLADAHKRFSKDVMVHLSRAESYALGHQYQKALKECRQALRLNPRCVPALVLRAQLFAVLDRVAEALRELDHAEKFDPSQASVHYSKAAILVSAEQYEECMPQMEKAFELGLAWEPMFEPWGECMLGLGRGDEMMSILKSRSVDPADPGLFRLRSWYYGQKGQDETALREADQAIALSSGPPEMARSYRVRARVHAIGKRFRLAAEDMQKVIALSIKGTFQYRTSQELLHEFLSMDESVSAVS